MDYRLLRVGNERILQIDVSKAPFPPLIEESGLCMAEVVRIIKKVREVDRVVLLERKIREYDPFQTSLLKEIAEVSRELWQMFLPSRIRPRGCRIGSDWVAFIKRAFAKFPADPIGVFVELNRERRWAEIEAERAFTEEERKCLLAYVKFLRQVITKLSGLKLIKLVEPFLDGYKVGDRSIYKRVFRAVVRPNFTYTKLLARYPEGEEIDSYKVGNAEVTIIKIPGKVRLFYHLLPPEFKLSEIEYEIIEGVKATLEEFKPKSPELIEPEAIRETVFNIALDIIAEEEERRGIKLEKEKLAEIVTRETVGFGVLELLLQDERVQDITINAPYVNPVFVYHADAEDCETNIYPTPEEARAWAARLRLYSGRPLDESNPVLDTEIEIGKGIRARVAAVTKSFSPFGLSFAIRRHRAKPWTLPLFIKVKMLSPLAAGLISFLVDGARTMLVAGTRGAGKTSLLQAIMVEIMRRYRIITVEDTLELPVRYFMKLGYNIQPLKVRSPIIPVESELSAEQGIRTSLRLGDSALIIGEVRSKEAIALYEAMRVGALANVVAGTIHGDSPYGVFDRVVHDLKVPVTSFKATDIILIANPIRTAGGLKKYRRLIQITEVRKHWKEDPIAEGGFVDLMKYDAREDVLKPTSVLLDGESEIISAIASRVREWAGNFDAVWADIELRARIKETLVKVAEKTGREDLLEADFVVRANDAYHLFVEEVKEELGAAVPEEVYRRWLSWLKSAM